MALSLIASAPTDDPSSYPGPLRSHTQWVTIYALAIYIVVLSIAWNLKYARTIIYTGKLLTVAFHEGCHALATVITGGRVNSIQLDPNMGGVTSMDGGWLFLSDASAMFREAEEHN
ncbi:hypothetical protein OIV83_003003 [Microbotryomycetes sp. JL201]|nr:hypothetical protein OIV83_003003 [Microbotryomycetes sp. JL201]